MKERENKKFEKIFLDDTYFLLWRIAPSKESDAFWHNYINEHPNYQCAFDRAIEVLRSIRLNDYRLSLEESAVISDQLKLKYNKYRRNQTYLLYFKYSAVASFFLLCILTFLFIIKTPTSSVDYLAGLMDVRIDSTQTNIKLITYNDEKVILDEKAIITCDSEGNIRIKDKDVIIGKSKVLNDISKINTLIVPYGKHSTLILPDGSKIWANSGTILKFPSSFETNQRTIGVNGEIYIEVVKDRDRPFYVKTLSFDVKVLGTSFNVCAYHEDKEASVVLVKGSVEVNTARKENIQLFPNQLININESGTKSKNVDVYEYICWKDNKMLLTGRNAGETFDRLARYYSYTILCEDKIRELEISGKVDLCGNIEDIIGMVCNTLSVRYVLKENKVIIISKTH